MDIVPIMRKWDSKMTDRERFNAQMHYKETDRCFNMEFGYWDENYSEWRMFRDNGITNEEQANLFFSFDRIEVIGGNNWMCPPFPQKIVGENEKYLLHQNSDGLLAEVKKNGGSSIPHYMKSSITTPDDWDKVKKERFNLEDVGRKIDLDRLKAEHPVGEKRDYPLGINCGSMIGKIRDMLTFEGICYACFDYPEMVEDMVESTCRIIERNLDILLPEFDFDYACGWEDICFNGGPIVTVDFFKEIVVPRYKRINKKLKNFGIDIWYTDCDGDVRPILPLLLESGINCLFPFEVNSCAHPAELFAEYGKDLHIMGGVDKMKLGAGKEEIDKYLCSLEDSVKRGGYIPFCDHRCPPNVTEENYIYYLTRKKEMFGKIK